MKPRSTTPTSPTNSGGCSGARFRKASRRRSSCHESRRSIGTIKKDAAGVTCEHIRCEGTMTGPVAPAANATPTVDFENPWPGLATFREVDREFFRGRRSEADALFRIVMRERLTVLFGLSGLGKSSLLQAGLFPLLR